MSSTKPEPDRLSLEGGKYEVTYDAGKLTAKRYGEEWRDCTGDNLMYFLFEAARAKSPGDALHAAMQRACKELPEGWNASIQMERGSASLQVFDADGEEIDVSGCDTSDFAEKVEHALRVVAEQQQERPAGG